ncbi:MAG: transglutaminase family protein, partial [Chloroflexi bacterium]
MQVAARRGESVDILRETWELDPPVSVDELTDPYGNAIRRLTLAPGTARLRYEATVEVPGQP